MADVKRDDRGRIVKGSGAINPGGRPRKERAEVYWNILISTLTDEVWHDIILKAVEQARDGDRHARKFLSDYGIGTAEQRLALYQGESSTLTVEYVNDWRKAGDDTTPDSDESE